MKIISLILLLLSGTLIVSAQKNKDLIGAWQRSHQGNQQSLVFTAGYWSFTEYNIEEKKFIGTIGGSFEISGSEFAYVVEFNTLAEFENYKPLEGKVKIGSIKLAIGNKDWKRTDNGTPGDLQGTWLITGRKRDGKIVSRTPGARKTMKILSGTRFQWIAYNSETMEFQGTGGGTYTTADGKYTEHIEFFSRDDSRVGASLEFNYSLEDGAWHHSGKSSKGQPIYEIWSIRTAENSATP